MPEECRPHLADVHGLAVLPHAKAAAVDLKHQPVGSHPTALGGEEKYYSFFYTHKAELDSLSINTSDADLSHR